MSFFLFSFVRCSLSLSLAFSPPFPLLRLTKKRGKNCKTKVAEGDYRLRTWLDSVDGCACCLSRTEGVSECFLRARGCGGAAAMKACCAPLEGKGRTCENPGYWEEVLGAAEQSAAAAAARALGGGGAPSAGAAGAPHRRLRNLLASGGVAFGAAETAETCAGRAEIGVGGCPPGKRPVVTVTALHEVHGEIFFTSRLFSDRKGKKNSLFFFLSLPLSRPQFLSKQKVFIFSMALTHIFACVLLIVMSSLRVRSWRRWEEGAADGGGGAAAKGLSPAPPPAPSDASAAAAAAADALEAGPSASAPAVEMGAAAAALGLGLSRKRVSFLEEIEGGRGAAAAAVAAGKKTAPETATTTTTTTAVTPSQRRRSVLLQRADKLDGFWPKLGEVGICILRQLLVLFPVTKREYLEMREAWMAAHGLDGSGAAAVAAAGGKGKEEGCCCCCCRESKGDGDGGDGCGGGGDGKGEKCCSCGGAASSSLPPICFADYVMKSFDDDVAGIVGLVRREFFLFLVRARRRRKNLNLDLLSTSISTRFFFQTEKKNFSLFPRASRCGSSSSFFCSSRTASAGASGSSSSWPVRCCSRWPSSSRGSSDTPVARGRLRHSRPPKSTSPEPGPLTLFPLLLLLLLLRRRRRCRTTWTRARFSSGGRG